MGAGSTERTWVLSDEVIPVRLMSTIWADVDGIHDDFGSPEDVDAWLDAVGLDRHGSKATTEELGRAHRLRDAARRLAAEVTADDRAAARSATRSVESALRNLNQSARQLPAPQLVRVGHGFEETESTGRTPVTAALAQVARETIVLFGGPESQQLRACHAPGCVLYFMKTHPRREWCSIACGNRARAARHYEKVRSSR